MATANQVPSPPVQEASHDESATPPIPDASTSVAHKAQLGLGLGLLSYGHLKGDSGGSLSTVKVGTLASGSITIGYGVTDSVIVAADWLCSYTNQSGSGASATQTEFSVLPTLQYMFPGSPMYIGALAGIDIISASSGDSEETDALFVAGAAIGAHTFVTNAVTVDPVFTAAYVTGSATLRNDTDIQLSGFILRLSLGLSVWL